MGWLRPKTKPSADIPEVQSKEECDSLLSADLAVLFKHSSTCPVSWMAHREVTKFVTAKPAVPVRMIAVREQREISRYLAERTGVQHESPQVIVVRKGALAGHASHDDVTAELLEELSNGN